MKTEEERKSVSLQVVQRLDNFIKRTKLSKIIMDVVAHTLLPEQIADLRVQFTKFDKSESGQISLADMRSILIQFPGFQEDHLNDIFLNLDIDQTGTPLFLCLLVFVMVLFVNRFQCMREPYPKYISLSLL